MTAVIDRLERAGYVRRLPDPDDRRRVLVSARPRSIERIKPLYKRLAASTAALNARYDDRQLAVVLEYLARALDLVSGHVIWLQTQQPLRRPPAGRQPRGPDRRRPRMGRAARLARR
jgi:hypothetical protein